MNYWRRPRPSNLLYSKELNVLLLINIKIQLQTIGFGVCLLFLFNYCLIFLAWYYSALESRKILVWIWIKKYLQYVTLFPYQCAIMTLDYYKHKCDQDLERTDECYCWPHVNFCIFFWQRFLDILIYWPEIYTTWQHTEGWLFVCDGGRYLALGTGVCWYHCQRSQLSTLLYPPTRLTEMGEKVIY